MTARDGDRRTASAETRFTIQVLSAKSGVRLGRIRYYERQGLVQPATTSERVRWYSEDQIVRLQQIERLIDDLGVNLAAVEVILNMRDNIIRLQEQLAARPDVAARE